MPRETQGVQRDSLVRLRAPNRYLLTTNHVSPDDISCCIMYRVVRIVRCFCFLKRINRRIEKLLIVHRLCIRKRNRPLSLHGRFHFPNTDQVKIPRTFSCSHAAFSTNATKVQKTQLSSYMICIQKTKPTSEKDL